MHHFQYARYEENMPKNYQIRSFQVCKPCHQYAKYAPGRDRRGGLRPELKYLAGRLTNESPLTLTRNSDYPAAAAAKSWAGAGPARRRESDPGARAAGGRAREAVPAAADYSGNRGP